MESRIDDEKVVLSLEIQDALNALNRQFGKDLFLAKFDTCCAAFEALKGLSVADERREALGKHVRDWIARCAVSVQKWVPKYAALAHSAGILNENKWKWVEDRITRKLRSMCIGGDRLARWGGPIETWEPIQWWIRNACHKAAVFGIVRNEPWKVPKWLAPTKSSDPIGYYHTILQAELGRELSWALDLAKIEAATTLGSAPGRPEDSQIPPRGLVSAVGPAALLKPGEGPAGFWSRLSEDLNDPGPAIKLLEGLGFGAKAQEWPSSSFGPVLPEILTHLKRAQQILTARGFRIVDDPVNPLGDGRSWVLRCVPTDRLPNDADPADLIDRYLGEEGIKVAATPTLIGQALIVCLWDSGRAYPHPFELTVSKRADERRSEVADSPTLLRFVQRGDKTVAEKSDDHHEFRTRLFNTHQNLILRLSEVRSVIRSRKEITVKDLQEQFRNTDFGRAADSDDWKILISELSNCAKDKPAAPRTARKTASARRSAGSGNLVIALLARKTGLTNSTVQTYLKQHRKQQKSEKSPTIP